MASNEIERIRVGDKWFVAIRLDGQLVYYGPGERQMTYRVGVPALAPAAQVAWIEKHVDQLTAERDALREALEQVAAAFSEDDKAEALERIRLIVTAPGLVPSFAKSKAAAEGNDAETGAVHETLKRSK